MNCYPGPPLLAARRVRGIGTGAIRARRTPERESRLDELGEDWLRLTESRRPAGSVLGQQHEIATHQGLGASVLRSSVESSLASALDEAGEKRETLGLTECSESHRSPRS